MNTINEGIIDKRIKQTVDWSKTSDTYLKYMCIAASPIVGKYTHATQQIADGANRSPSTVQNWAHAHWLYKDVRRTFPHTSRLLWRVLPASHWWLAYDIQTKGYDALHYLALADDHKLSGREMMQEYKADMESGNAPMITKRAVIAFCGLADELLKEAYSVLERLGNDATHADRRRVRVLKLARDVFAEVTG